MSVLDEIYDAVTDEAAYARLPHVLAKAARARSSVIMEFDRTFQVRAHHTHYYSAEMNERYIAGNFAQHDVWNDVARLQRRFGVVARLEEDIDADAFRRTVIYNELFRHFGDDTARCMGVVLQLEDGFITIAVHRPYADNRFEPSDAAVLQRLLPHLKRLTELRTRLGVSAARTQLMHSALDALGTAMLITDGQGRIQVSNAAAEALVGASDGLKLENGRLTTSNPAQAERLANALSTAANRRGLQGDAFALARRHGAALRVHVAPLAGPITGAMVLVEDSEAQDAQMAGTLERLYGLTPTESQVAVLLIKGRRIADIAAGRGVSVLTARTQAKSIYNKVGVAGQVELMALPIVPKH